MCAHKFLRCTRFDATRTVLHREQHAAVVLVVRCGCGCLQCTMMLMLRALVAVFRRSVMATLLRCTSAASGYARYDVRRWYATTSCVADFGCCCDDADVAILMLRCVNMISPCLRIDDAICRFEQPFHYCLRTICDVAHYTFERIYLADFVCCA